MFAFQLAELKPFRELAQILWWTLRNVDEGVVDRKPTAPKAIPLE